MESPSQHGTGGKVVESFLEVGMPLGEFFLSLKKLIRF